MENPFARLKALLHLFTVSSSASVLHGIVVNAHDLVRGARTFAKFTKNAAVLDLLLARKPRNTIGVPVSCSSRHCDLSTTSLSTLPAELLFLIRDHLRRSYINSEPSYFLNELHWEHFNPVFNVFGREELADEGPAVWGVEWSERRWEEHVEWHNCQLCLDEEYEVGQKYHHGGGNACTAGPCSCSLSSVSSATVLSQRRKLTDPSQLKRIRELFHYYGLSLPGTHHFTDAGQPYSVRDLSYAITLPSARENASGTMFVASESIETASSVHSIPYDEPDLQTVTYFGPSYFRTTDEDDRSFCRLVRDLELRVVEFEGGLASR